MMTSLFASILTLTNLCGSVSVDTLGARVVSYVPAGGGEVFFVSETGTGGMPLCWPWFAGLGPSEGSRRHGIARYRDFTVVSNAWNSPSDSELTLRLESDAGTRSEFPHDFSLTVKIRLAERLCVSMTGGNAGNTPFAVTAAFHPYFAVCDSTRCQVDGVQAMECRLSDPVSGAGLSLAREGGGFRVWRPARTSNSSKNVTALAPDDWKKFICIESGTFSKDDAYVLRPGESHTLSCTILPLHPAMATTASPCGSGQLVEVCGRPVLEKGDELSSWGAVYNELFDLDAAADDAWRAVGSVAAFDARRSELRAKMLERIGVFPERTPLNAKNTDAVARDGYRMEKIVFESRPGAYVTANLYLPSAERFSPPYPAALELCGHSPLGKSAPKYQRVAVMMARCGVAAFVVDPLCQGERRQCAEEPDGNPTAAHLRLGANAMLLGHGLAAFEIWDAIRALDYLDTRTDIRHDGYGSFGNSGGGTQSVMLSALDDRIQATATSCFLSNLREQTRWRLLADSEQLVFAQLKDGLNHAAYPLLGGNPVMMLARRDDMIPFTGTRETYRVLAKVAANLKRDGWYSMLDVSGPHGYCERTMRATVEFMTGRLRGEVADLTGVDYGPTPEEGFVTKTGRVMDVLGFKSAYDYLCEELDVALASRVKKSAKEMSALVRRLADIDESRLGTCEVLSSCDAGNGVKAVRMAYKAKGGYRVPAVEFVPSVVKAAPALVVGDGPRTNRMGSVERLLSECRPVMLADVIATGEIGGTRHYYNNPNDDEETAKMLYLVGSSLVGRRAGEIIALARDLKVRSGQAPSVVAHGRTAVAAAHAFAAAPEAFAAVEVHDAPVSWTESVRTRAFYDYAAAVHGGLKHYDWPDLLDGRSSSYSIPLADEYVREARAAYGGAGGDAYDSSVLSGKKYANDKLAAARLAREPWSPPSVRWCAVDGVRNVRDCGGWNGLKPGMVFRGGEMDSAKVAGVADAKNPNRKKRDYGNVTDQGRKAFREIGIKTDLDLRGVGKRLGRSAIGEGVNYVVAPIGAYLKLFDGLEPVAECMRVFARPENYPVYVHCAGGADRTGSLLFLLEGLCGVAEADLAIDYELTSFGLERRHRTDGSYKFASFVRKIKEYPGATLKDKVEAFVRRDLGLSETEVESIRRSLCVVRGS